MERRPLAGICGRDFQSRRERIEYKYEQEHEYE
jgi:hypothetical protein